MNRMKTVIAIFLAAGLITAFPSYINAEEDAVITVKAESDVVRKASGETVSVKSYCPEERTLIGGGGVCFGFLNTENKVLLTVSAPSPDEKDAWFVVCTNVNDNAGEAQAMAWAMCVDSELLEPEEKKKK